MKVILLKDIKNLGLRGTVKEVADSYAVNVLIPKGFVIRATDGELAKWKQKEDSQKHKKEMLSNTFVQLIDVLRKNEIHIGGKKHDDKGQLFASIKEKDIAEAIFSVSKLSVDEKQIHIEKPIKQVGVHEVYLKQGGRKEKISVFVS